MPEPEPFPVPEPEPVPELVLPEPQVIVGGPITISCDDGTEHQCNEGTADCFDGSEAFCGPTEELEV